MTQDRPLRVLQVVGQMYRAGAETLLMNLYRNIDRNLVQFDFLTHRQERGDYDDEIEALGGNVYCLCPMSLQNSAKYARMLGDFFREHPYYRIVHSHLDAMSSLPLAAAKRAGVEVRIAHSHNTAFPRDKKYPLRLVSQKLIPLTATHYFACSDESAKFLFPKQVFEKKNYQVLKNAIELNLFAYREEVRKQMRAELGIASGTLAVGHVGRFCQQKNHRKLLRIFACLHRQFPDSLLLLAGRGELLEEMKSLCSQLKLEKAVKFLGVRSDIEDLMQAFDVFVLPSLYEGFPVVGVEAQAAGLPCLFSDRVKRDIALTNAVKFLPLEAEDEVWAREVLELQKTPRFDNTGILAKKGFDIGEQAENMTEFYQNAVGIGEESGIKELR